MTTRFEKSFSQRSTHAQPVATDDISWTVVLGKGAGAGLKFGGAAHVLAGAVILATAPAATMAGVGCMIGGAAWMAAGQVMKAVGATALDIRDAAARGEDKSVKGVFDSFERNLTTRVFRPW